MHHLGTKKLETKRLILRKFNNDDYINMYNNWAKEKEVARFMPWSSHKNTEETKNIIDLWISKYENSNEYNWVIEIKESNEIIGTITVVKQSESNDCCEIGYASGTKYWGHGYMPEALKRVIKFLFEEVGFHRIEAKHATENPNSGKVMQKSGMTYEGTLKQKFKLNDGTYVDTKIYGIINNVK